MHFRKIHLWLGNQKVNKWNQELVGPDFQGFYT